MSSSGSRRRAEGAISESDEFQPLLQLARVSPERRFFLCQKTGKRISRAGWIVSLEALDPLGQRLRAPAERRVHRRFESAQRLLAGHDAFGQGVLVEVGAQARHGAGEVAPVDADERALFCPGQVFVPALHPSRLPWSASRVGGKWCGKS